MSLHSLSKLMVSLSFLACTSAFAIPVTVGVLDVQSVGEFGESGNTTYTLAVGANATITSISYNVNLTAYLPSTLGDISLLVSDTLTRDGVSFSPADGSAASGSGTFAGFIDLAAQNAVFSVGSDGLLRFEFFELTDNLPGADGVWNSGTITFDITQVPVTPGGNIPEPASAVLMAAGLAMMGIAARRRRRNAGPSRTAPTLH
jgi:hypothetical protein